MNKLLSFTISLATQIWSLFVLMTIWNWFASEWYVFTLMQLMWLQLFGRSLIMTTQDVIIAKSFSEDKTETIPVNVASSVMFLLALSVAYIVKCFQ